MRYLRKSLRFRLFLLVFLAIAPGFLLTIYSIITRQHQEILTVLLIAVISLIAAWFGGNALIVRSVNALILLAKRLSTGDLTARSGAADHFSSLSELYLAFDQMAGALEERALQLHRRADEFTALVEIMSELATQQDLSALLQVIAEKAMVLLNVANATITLYDPALDELAVTLIKGYQVPVGTRIRMGEGTIGRAAQARQPMIVNNYQTWEDRLPEFEAVPISAMMHVPMVYQRELIGVLGVAEIEPATRKFNQEDLQLLSLFAGEAASSIKIARLFEETRCRLRELEVINEVSRAARIASGIDEMLTILLEKTMALVDASMESIWLYDPADNTLRQMISNGFPDLEIPLRPGEGIIGTVFSTGQPYLTLDWKEDRLTHSSTRSKIPAGLSGAFIPIRTAQAIVGVLTIGFHAPQALSEHQIQLVTTIAENAGNAIYRMQLHEKMRSRLQRLSALHQIDLAITSSLDLGKTLQVMLDQVINQLGVDAACALVFNPYEQTLEFAASRGFTTDALRYTRLKLSEGYAGQAALKLQTIHIPDLRTRNTDFLRSPAFAAEGFVTYYAVPLVTRSQVKGVLEVFHRSSLDSDPEWLDFLETLASQTAIAIDDAALYIDLQRSNSELNLAYNSTLEGWSRALDLRDRETQGHSQRVTEMALRLARAMSIDESDLVHIRRGALLHDIGKLGIPDDILLKHGPLSEEEMERIRNHPAIANELLAPIAYLRPALDIPYCHHEKWNGSGYPRGLKGEEIPLAARIFAVVDVWDALISDRPYRKRWPEEKARAYLQEQAGQHFDPRVVDAFLALLNEDSKRAQTSGTEQ
jgi:response regulator RpfG family c-di-GMP phosphodiesterase/nitrate/nitrite-specific signal transduction histidine kinase